MFDSLFDSMFSSFNVPQSWDRIFDSFKSSQVEFNRPPYTAVRVNADYVLVKVPLIKRSTS